MAHKRPTILQIIPELDTGGAELSAVEIAGAVVRAGGRAIVLSEGGRLAPRISAAGGEFVPFPAATKNPARIYWNVGKIHRMIVREGVDLVHARSRAPAWSAMLAARRAEKPFVTTYHGAHRERTRLKRAYNAVMAKGDLVIANSHYTKNLLMKRYATPSDRIRVIYRGVDGNVFDPNAVSAERKAALLARWGATPETRIILLPARLSPWKGHSTVIAAIRQLRDESLLDGALVVFAGDAQGRDAYRQRIMDDIRAKGLEGRILLPGHEADMVAAFAVAHLALVASTEPEAFGRVAIEAQAMGCPVIATDIGAPPETVAALPNVGADEVTGWLVPPGDAGRLADAIAEALNLSPEIRLAQGRRARDRVLAHFTLTAMRLATLDVYDRLLGTGLRAAYENSRL